MKFPEVIKYDDCEAYSQCKFCPACGKELTRIKSSSGNDEKYCKEHPFTIFPVFNMDGTIGSMVFSPGYMESLWPKEQEKS